MTTTGIHLLTEFSGCPAQKLSDLGWLTQLLANAAQTASASVLSSFFNRLSPSGVAGVLCLSEAQVSIRTWPDAGYATIDIYACGSVALPRVLLSQFIKDFGAKCHQTVELERGIADAAVFKNRVVDAPSSPTTVAAPASALPDPSTAKIAVRKRHVPQPIE